MKLLHFSFFFLFSVAVQAQSNANLNYGTSIAFDEVDIEFVDVLEDSRCPKNVNCVQAGRAVVLVNVYANGKFLEERKLEFHPSGFSNESLNTIFNAEGSRITGLNLMPYPVALSKTPKEAYFLELAIDY
ncbi:MAG: hypothetical protein KJN66_01865 [Bacteroidia bacterium]|nr:hypothetical protein [Bacteroidia bacterium]